jgi:hypothetical protein
LTSLQKKLSLRRITRISIIDITQFRRKIEVINNEELLLILVVDGYTVHLLDMNKLKLVMVVRYYALFKTDPKV